MNKVLNVNLGGYPFTVDEDAYEQLKQYLDALRKHFKQTEGAEEIVSDIEMRLAEIFQDKLEERPILTLAIVNSGIDIMGTPEDFGAEAGFEEFANSGTEEKSSKQKYTHRTGKRLFRNEDDEIIGGVCSGLSAYLGIQDPVWLRLLFVLMALGSFGFIIPLYIIMLIIVPEAKTAADKLAMKGEPINVDNIAKMIQDEMVNLSETISKMSNNGKKKVNASSFDEAKVRETVEQGMGIVGDVIKGIWYFLTHVIRPVLIFIGAVIIVVLALIWIATIIGTIFVYPHAGYLLTEPSWQVPLATASSLVMVGVPLLSAVFLVTRLFFSTPINIKWSIGIWILFGISIGTFVYSMRTVAEDFDQSATIVENIELPNPNVEVMKVDANSLFERRARIGNDFITANNLIIPNVQLELEPSEDDQFHLTKRMYARGGTAAKARVNIDNIVHETNIKENKLTFDNALKIEKGNKWRVQRVKYVLQVPEGKTVDIAENMGNILHPNHSLGFSPWHFQGHSWTLNDSEFECATCENENEDSNKQTSKLELPFEAPFQKLWIEGNTKVYINKANTHAINYKGVEEYTNQIEVNQEGEQVKIIVPSDHTGKPTRIYIDMPSLTGLEVHNTDDVEVKGFEEDKITMHIDIESELRARIKAEYLDLTATDDAAIQLKGGGEFLKVNLTDDAELDADRYLVQVAEVQGTNRNEAKVNVRDTLFKQMPDIKFEGEPVVMER